MSDKRKFNGGHSTKSDGIDKRKNEYREALEQAGGVQEVVDVLKMLYERATKDQDIKAAQLYLSYYLGRPHETKDINIEHQDQPIFEIMLTKDD